MRLYGTAFSIIGPNHQAYFLFTVVVYSYHTRTHTHTHTHTPKTLLGGHRRPSVGQVTTDAGGNWLVIVGTQRRSLIQMIPCLFLLFGFSAR